MPLKAFPSELAQNESQLSNFIHKFEVENEFVSSVTLTPPNVKDENGRWLPQEFHFHLPTKSFVSECVKFALEDEKGNFGRNSIFPEEDQLKVLVEFSSPNVAKPFHVGHLRSTLIGNFCANIYECVGHEVIRVNYLGDCGTQFGLILAQIEKNNFDLNSISDDPIGKLYQIYVEANAEAEKNEDFAQRARLIFTELEDGNTKLKSQWKIIRDFTISELEKTYERLGVRFDHFHGEAMYTNEHNREIIDKLENENLFEELKDGRKAIRVPIKLKSGKTEDKMVTVLKSDGSTLYITRDIAAAVHRKSEFGFDRMFYVVEQGQKDHFKGLFGILDRMGFDWSRDLSHVTFGRINGMSSRKGTAVFLKVVFSGSLKISQ